MIIMAVPAASAQVYSVSTEKSRRRLAYMSKTSLQAKYLINHNGQMALTPASVMKALTTASVLSVSGSNARFSTPVTLTGNRDGSTLAW